MTCNTKRGGDGRVGRRGLRLGPPPRGRSRQKTLVPDPHPAPRVIPHAHVVERPADRVLPVLLEIGSDLWEKGR
eukprot:scaffold126088_cov63-Phaeocystis_antarctica.AAC.4